MVTFGFNRMALRATQPNLNSMFSDLFLKIALLAAELMPFVYLGAAICHRLWGAIKDKCYADKPETINALKYNIRKAIGEIRLLTIDNVLKN